MKDAVLKRLGKEIFEKASKALRVLPPDIEMAILSASQEEDDPYACAVFDAIRKNIAIAKETPVPLCQDTGMFWVLVDVGSEYGPVDLAALEQTITSSLAKAAEEACYRKSIVAEPVFDRINTLNNLPAVINYGLCQGGDISIKVLLKGFGSENCTGLVMLRPTDGEDGVVDAVCGIVEKAGGKPCPPMFLGIGIGGTADRAAFLSKKAFFSGHDHADGRYACLEKKILERVNGLNIGAGGLGGRHTALDARILAESTHIAGMPLCVSISCWADRQFEVVLNGGC